MSIENGIHHSARDELQAAGFEILYALRGELPADDGVMKKSHAPRAQLSL